MILIPKLYRAKADRDLCFVCAGINAIANGKGAHWIDGLAKGSLFSQSRGCFAFRCLLLQQGEEGEKVIDFAQLAESLLENTQIRGTGHTRQKCFHERKGYPKLNRPRS